MVSTYSRTLLLLLCLISAESVLARSSSRALHASLPPVAMQDMPDTYSGNTDTLPQQDSTHIQRVFDMTKSYLEHEGISLLSMDTVQQTKTIEVSDMQTQEYTSF